MSSSDSGFEELPPAPKRKRTSKRVTTRGSSESRSRSNAADQQQQHHTAAAVGTAAKGKADHGHCLPQKHTSRNSTRSSRSSAIKSASRSSTNTTTSRANSRSTSRHRFRQTARKPGDARYTGSDSDRDDCDDEEDADGGNDDEEEEEEDMGSRIGMQQHSRKQWVLARDGKKTPHHQAFLPSGGVRVLQEVVVSDSSSGDSPRQGSGTDNDGSDNDNGNDCERDDGSTHDDEEEHSSDEQPPAQEEQAMDAMVGESGRTAAATISKAVTMRGGRVTRKLQASILKYFQAPRRSAPKDHWPEIGVVPDAPEESPSDERGATSTASGSSNNSNNASSSKARGSKSTAVPEHAVFEEGTNKVLSFQLPFLFLSAAQPHDRCIESHEQEEIECTQGTPGSTPSGTQPPQPAQEASHESIESTAGAAGVGEALPAVASSESQSAVAQVRLDLSEHDGDATTAIATNGATTTPKLELQIVHEEVPESVAVNASGTENARKRPRQTAKAQAPGRKRARRASPASVAAAATATDASQQEPTTAAPVTQRVVLALRQRYTSVQASAATVEQQQQQQQDDEIRVHDGDEEHEATAAADGASEAVQQQSRLVAELQHELDRRQQEVRSGRRVVARSQASTLTKALARGLDC